METSKKMDYQTAVKQLNELKQNYETARAIVTTEGFYQMWFNSLPNYNTPEGAFNVLNELHYNIVHPPRYKYESYKSFQTYFNSKPAIVKN